MTDNKNFDPSKITPVGDSFFVEVFAEEKLLKGPAGAIVKAGQVLPEPYALVHAASKNDYGIKPGDYVLLKPSLKGGFEIQEIKYMFIQTYDIDAIIPKEYLKYFASTKTEAVKTKVNPTIVN